MFQLVKRGRCGVAVLIVLVCLGLSVGPSFAGQIYKWRDSQGRLHFSDTPVDETTELIRETDDKSPQQGDAHAGKPATEKQAGSPPGPQPLDPDAGVIRIPYIAKEGGANRVIVNVKFNDWVTAPMMVDTGAPGLVISISLAQRLRLFEKDGSQLLVAISGIGGSQAALRTIIDKVAIGKMAADDTIPAHIVADMSGAYEGLVGMDILAGYSITIDPASQEIVARPVPKSKDRPGGHDKAWWRGKFREFKAYKAYWDHHAQLVNKVGSAYSRMFPEKRERYKAFIVHQQDEADKLVRKFTFKANRHYVPKHWRE